jgi:hypothetical protein
MIEYNVSSISEVAAEAIWAECSEAFYPLIGGPLTTYQIVLRAPRNVCGLSPCR